MADLIGRFGEFGNYRIGGRYNAPKKEEVTEQEKAPEQEKQARDYKETQVDPSKVMDFLAQNQVFVSVNNRANKKVEEADFDEGAEARMDKFMQQFEAFYSVAADEFGDKLAPSVVDAVLDRFMM